MLSKYSKARLYVAALITAATTVFSASVFAGDAEKGKVLADTCKGCHAVDSYTNVYPTYHVPRVAGQSEDYLIAALQLYRDGNRQHSTMTAQAASLTDDQIADIAAYIASVEPALSPEAAPKGTAPEAAAVCAACHGPAGVSLAPINPNLAGQHLSYLRQATAQYKSGQRKGPNAIAMQAQLGAISDEDLDAVLKFYAAQDGLSSLDMN
jgi:cytochrome c553